MLPNQPANDAEEQRIRWKIEKRHQEWQGFVIHVAVFLMVNLVIWAAWGMFNYMPAAREAMISALSIDKDMVRILALPVPLVIMVGWAVGLVAHYIHYYLEFGPGLDRMDREIQREIERYREQRSAFEKPKNEQRTHLELTEDGEIEEIRDNDPQVSRRARR